MNWPADFVDQIILGNSLEVLKDIPDGSIDLTISSPPYGVGKAYERTDGKQDPFWKTIWLLNRMFRELSRVTKPGGYICWNFGDNAYGKKINQTETLSTIPMAIWYWPIGEKYGLELQATRIWRKRFATMAKPFYLNHHPRHVMDYEHIWTWRKPDGTGKETVNEHKVGRRGVWASTPQDEAFEGVYEGNILGKHTARATFPEMLPEWCLTVYSKPGQIVLDPFLGSGTTCAVSKRMGRHYIGIELNEPDWEYARNRVLQTEWDAPVVVPEIPVVA